MALREGKCFLVRRVTNRGIDKNIGGSHTWGRDGFLFADPPVEAVKESFFTYGVQLLKETKLGFHVRD